MEKSNQNKKKKLTIERCGSLSHVQITMEKIGELLEERLVYGLEVL
jgi:hypothetical protein